jgi:RNA polymerase sigma-70 factor (ECF subfamily)
VPCEPAVRIAGPGRRSYRSEVEPFTDADLEGHRRELTGYCYRMLGSVFEAEDAVQETMIRAWRALDRFDGRSSLRTWLYRIATNVCLDQLDGRGRRARPVDLGPGGSVDERLPADAWVEPVPTARVTDPADAAVARESIRLAFVAALQHLSPGQRSVLLLREVLGLRAAEVAQLQDTSVAAVNSTLQRARATLAAQGAALSSAAGPGAGPGPGDAGTQRALLDQYVAAFERFDMSALAMLLHVDATLSMAPLTLWMRGPDEITSWWLGTGVGCRGSRLVPTVANGAPAFGQYRPARGGAGYEPWALQVVEIADGRIKALQSFLDTDRLFPLFGLPPRLEAAAA